MKKYYSKRKPLAKVRSLIVVLIAFTLIFYFITGNFKNLNLSTVIIFSLFYILLLTGIIKALQNKPTLIISEEGIIDNATFGSPGKVNWDKILEIDISKGTNVDFLIIKFVNEREILSSVNSVKRFFMKTNKKKLGTICAIPDMLVNDDLNNIINVITKLRRQK